MLIYVNVLVHIVTNIYMYIANESIRPILATSEKRNMECLPINFTY